jgi:acetyl esterase
MSEPFVRPPFVRPDVAQFLQYLNAMPGPKIEELDPIEARKVARGMRDVADLPTGPLAVLRDVMMPGPAGDLTLRLFDARADRDPGPVLVFIHGGGWTFGDLDLYEPLCAEIARVLDLPVVSVEYRLAPEHPWPAAPDDCEAAARWIASAPEALGLRPTGLVLAGDSAGGNLAIITAMALRDRPAAAPVIAQWAAYPAADLATHYPSYKQFADGYFLTRASILWFAANYTPDPASWRASPMQGNLAGLPPALVTTASLDPIRDQGRAYAAGLANAGVPVTFREAEGTIHGFLTLRRAIPSARADLAAGLAALKAILMETGT